MSEQVEISKEIEIDVDGNSICLKKQIAVLVHYVDCACGERLKFSVAADKWGELQIEVETHSCEQDHSSESP